MNVLSFYPASFRRAVLFVLLLISGCAGHLPEAIGQEFQDNDWTAGKDMTKEFEGFRANVYLCPAGARTIGYGFNLQDPYTRTLLDENVVSGKRPITEDEANWVLNMLYARAIDDAMRFIGVDAFGRLTVEQRHILIEMAYNLGSRRLSGFKRLRAAIRAEDYSRASVEMKDSAWYWQTGRRARHHVAVFPRTAK